MTSPTPPSRRRFWIWGATIAVAVAGLGASYLGMRERSTPEPPSAPAATAAATTEAVTTTAAPATVATGPGTTAASITTTARTTTTTTVASTTVAVARPTTTATPTTEAATTTQTPPVPVEAGEHEHHADAVLTEDTCHTHDEAVVAHCHTYELPPTTAPDPEAAGDCPGNYHQWFKVRDECVLSEVKKEYLAYHAGSHTQRMAAIRDGYLLETVFTQSAINAEQYFGKDAANDLSAWTSVYANTDNRSTRQVEVYGAQWIDHNRIDVRIRTVMRDGSFAWAWNVVPFTYVDGQWKVSYQGFCRFIDASIGFVRDHGGTLHPCPPDPRPGVVALEHIYSAYDPTDDPTRTRVNKTPGW